MAQVLEDDAPMSCSVRLLVANHVTRIGKRKWRSIDHLDCHDIGLGDCLSFSSTLCTLPMRSWFHVVRHSITPCIYFSASSVFVAASGTNEE
jgi:hypothetical protein